MSGSCPVAVLAEDQAIARAVAADTLSGLGFEVLPEARDGAALVYTAYNMPGQTDGCGLAHPVRARRPGTRIIVCSGCTRAEAALPPASARFIVKPRAEPLGRKALVALRPR